MPSGQRKTTAKKTGLQHLSPQLLEPHPQNPRLEVDAALSVSMEANSLLQPAIVRPKPPGRYEIVCGARRWQGAVKAGWEFILCDVRLLSDREAIDIMVAENLDRQELNAVEKAKALKLYADAGEEHAEIGRRFQRSAAWVSNLLRILRLPEFWQNKIISGEIAERNARLLVPHREDADLLRAVASEMGTDPEYWTGREFEASLAALLENRAQAGIGEPDGDDPIAETRAAIRELCVASESTADRTRRRRISRMSKAEARDFLRPHAENAKNLALIRDTAQAMIDQLAKAPTDDKAPSPQKQSRTKSAA